MKCTKCGAEFNEGVFCPECGTKLEVNQVQSEEKKEEIATNETKEEVKENLVSKVEIIENQKQASAFQVTEDESVKTKEKIPWYLSWLFIVVLLVLSFFIGIFWIPFIVLLVVRLIRMRKTNK